MTDTNGEVDPNAVTYGEGQTETQGGGEVALSDDDITAILQRYGVADDSGTA